MSGEHIYDYRHLIVPKQLPTRGDKTRLRCKTLPTTIVRYSPDDKPVQAVTRW